MAGRAFARFETWFNGRFPESHEKAAAILGGYAGLYVSYKVISGLFGGKKQAVPHTQPTISAPSTEKPVLSQSNEEGGFQGPTVENADVWFGNPDNIKAFEEWASKPENLDAWAKSL